MKKILIKLACIALLGSAPCLMAKSKTCCALNTILQTVNRIEQCACKATCDTIAITGPTTITQPGTYCLANDIQGTINIQADNVTILGNNRILCPKGCEYTVGVNGINVAGNNATVLNCTVNSFEIGINVTGQFNVIKEVGGTGNKTGINFNGTNNNITQNCTIANSLQNGIAIQDSNNIAILDSRIYNTGTLPATKSALRTTRAPAPTFNVVSGISITNSPDIVVDNNDIIGVFATTKVAGQLTTANGITVDATSHGFKSYNNNISSVSGSDIGYGHVLVPTLDVGPLGQTLLDSTNVVTSLGKCHCSWKNLWTCCGTPSPPPDACQNSPALVSGTYGTVLYNAQCNGTLTKVADVNTNGVHTVNDWDGFGDYFGFGPVPDGDENFKVSLHSPARPGFEKAFISTGANPVTAFAFNKADASQFGFGCSFGCTDFLALSFGDESGTYIQIFKFDKTTCTLTLFCSITEAAGSTVTSLDFSPDGNLLAAAFNNNGTTLFKIYSIDYTGTPALLERIAVDNTPYGITNPVLSWWPVVTNSQACYIALGGDATSPASNFRLFGYAAASTQANPGGSVASIRDLRILDTVSAVSWSTEGSHLAVGAHNGITSAFYTYITNELFHGIINPVVQDLGVAAKPTLVWSTNNTSILSAHNAPANLASHSGQTYALRSVIQDGNTHNVSASDSTHPLSTGVLANATTYASSNQVQLTLASYRGVGVVSSQAGAGTYYNVTPQ